MTTLPSKVCPVCGRRFEWRKKWQANWATVKYCSSRCQRARLDATDQAIEEAIRHLLHRQPGKVIALVAIADVIAVDPNSERVRNTARRLVANGEAVLINKGRIIEPEQARGPLHLRTIP